MALSYIARKQWSFRIGAVLGLVVLGYVLWNWLHSYVDAATYAHHH